MRAFKDEEFATVANTDKLELIRMEAFLRAVELHGSFEHSLEIKDQVAARIVDHDMLCIEEGDEVLVIFTTLGQ